MGQGRDQNLYRDQAQRWMRFNLVGIMGFLLQTITLSALVRWSGLPAALSVSIAVLVIGFGLAYGFKTLAARKAASRAPQAAAT